VAAYRLNRLLGLNHVPPAVTRSFHRDELLAKLPSDAGPYVQRFLAETIFDDEGFTRGELSHWIPVIVDTLFDKPEQMEQWTRWLTVGEPIPEEKRELMSQLSTLLVFDLLTNNSDRFSGGNLMASSDGKILFYMDNTFGFQLQPEGHERCRQGLARAQKFSRGFVAALRKLDARSIRDSFAPEPVELSTAEIESVLARRDVALRHIDNLVAQFGAAKVLVFP
jgi:hypothetical protein